MSRNSTSIFKLSPIKQAQQKFDPLQALLSGAVNLGAAVTQNKMPIEILSGVGTSVIIPNLPTLLPTIIPNLNPIAIISQAQQIANELIRNPANIFNHPIVKTFFQNPKILKEALIYMRRIDPLRTDYIIKSVLKASLGIDQNSTDNVIDRSMTSEAITALINQL